MRFSKTTGCFYPEDIQYSSLPDDLIKVTVDEYSAAMARSSDKTLDVLHGTLVIVDIPPPSAAQLWSGYQAQAQALLDKSVDSILLFVESAVPVPAEWAAYRKALRLIVSATSGDSTKPLPTRPGYTHGT